jgi:hypothetical protein
MKLLAFLLAFVTPPAQQQEGAKAPEPDTSSYQSLALGMKFNFPKAWELTTNKKGESKILIPIENTSDRAVVEIIPVNFRGEKVVWQLSQVGFNKTMKRPVERQWEEEILGVPVLLTKVNYDEKGSSRVSETGLLYTLGFNKLMYRVIAAPDEFDKADYAWRQVLLSLRTWDGEMPKVEDPSQKIVLKDPKVAAADAAKIADELPHPQVPHEINSQPKVKFVKAPSAATVELAGKQEQLHVPSDWKVETNKDGGFILHTPGVAGGVKVTVFPVAGSDPAAIALFKMSGTSLDDYTKVVDRQEALPKPNKAGTAVAYIWRAGKSAKGDLFTYEASGQIGDAYFLLSYRTENAVQAAGERKLIEALLDRMSIESAP